jgi:Domain of unknown function (DUF4389)
MSGTKPSDMPSISRMHLPVGPPLGQVERGHERIRIALFFLDIAAVLVVVVAWFATLITGRRSRGMFAFVQGVIRWHDRVIAGGITVSTDQYPPFRLAP